MTESSSSRKKWTKENMNVMGCFYRAQGERGYRKRMLIEWKKIYPQSDLSEQRLADQKRSIVTNHLLTILELDLLKQEICPRSVDTTIGSENQYEQSSSQVTGQPGEEDHHLSSHTQLDELSPEEYDMYNGVKNVLDSLQTGQLRARLHPLKNMNLNRDIAVANRVIPYFPVNCLEELSDLVYAFATVISTNNGYPAVPKSHCHQPSSVPAWKIRLQRKVDLLRRDVNKLQSVRIGGGRLPNHLITRYQIFTSHSIEEALEIAKQKLLAMSSRLTRYIKRSNFYHHNKLFKSNRTKFYRSVCDSQSNEHHSPPPEEALKF